MFSIDDTLKEIFLDINLIFLRIYDNYEVIFKTYFVGFLLVILIEKLTFPKFLNRLLKLLAPVIFSIPLFLGRANAMIIVNKFSARKIINTEGVNLASVGFSSLFSHMDVKIAAIVGSLIIYLDTVNYSKLYLHLIFLSLFIFLILTNFIFRNLYGVSQENETIWNNKKSNLLRKLVINIFIVSTILALVQALNNIIILEMNSVFSIFLLIILNLTPIINIFSPILLGLNLFLLNNIYLELNTSFLSILPIVILTFFLALNTNNSHIILDYGIQDLGRKESLNFIVKILKLKSFNNLILCLLILIGILYSRVLN